MRLLLTVAMGFSIADTSAQNLITNGSFEDPVFSSPSINNSPAVPGWSGIPFVFAGDNGSVWPSGATDGNQFADAGNGPAFVIEQTFEVPVAGLASISWKATTSQLVPTGTYRVELKTSPGGSLLKSQVFTVLGGAANKDIWDSESLDLSTSYGVGNYTLSFQSISTNGQDFFIDEVIALARPPSTISTTEKYTWAANAGWINFRPGIVVNEGFLSGLAYAANIGWINLGNGSPANGYQYSNADGDDSGVNLEADGKLTGLAWGANVGWIKFDWSGSSGSTRPRVNLVTGKIEGFAYGANIGWIKVTDLATETIHCIDSDGDTIGDTWEFEHFGNLTSANASSDSDGDADSDYDEYVAASDPNDAQDRAVDTSLRVVESPLPQFPNFWSIDFTARAGRLYQVSKSTDLQNWVPFNTPTAFSTGGSKSLAGAPVDSTQREFFRLIYSKPLQPQP